MPILPYHKKKPPKTIGLEFSPLTELLWF